MIDLSPDERMKRLQAFVDYSLRKMLHECAIRSGENHLQVAQVTLANLSQHAPAA